MASTDNAHIPRDIKLRAGAFPPPLAMATLPPYPLMVGLDTLWTRCQALQLFLATVDPHPGDVIYGYPGLLTRAQRVIARLIAEQQAPPATTGESHG
jgi:hypothetical protein